MALTLFADISLLLFRNGSQINQPVKKRKLSAGSIHVTMGTSQVKSEGK